MLTPHSAPGQGVSRHSTMPTVGFTATSFHKGKHTRDTHVLSIALIGDFGGLIAFHLAPRAACGLRGCLENYFVADHTAKITYVYSTSE